MKDSTVYGYNLSICIDRCQVMCYTETVEKQLSDFIGNRK